MNRWSVLQIGKNLIGVAKVECGGVIFWSEVLGGNNKERSDCIIE